jgi:putative membrane-bound dehydrogenase-like protein
MSALRHVAIAFALWTGLRTGISAEVPTSPRVNGNRLTYLDQQDPFIVGRDFPKLITPQWVGEPGVDAVIILAIDDMTDPARWELFLRPVLERLKRIDGRSPVSIMTVSVEPQDPQLQIWLKEGLSLEVHSLGHPCPLLSGNDFQKAANAYHGSVSLMNSVSGNHPVAFRMPCCDSMNSASPRFFAEIFNSTNASGQFLTIDSSVMNLTTKDDASLPRELVLDENGQERFRKYIPSKAFATFIEDYPYPYVVGKLCWEFPAMMPSDWEAQKLHGTNNPVTVRDWEAALDATVIKLGTMTFIFHPHGWIQAPQFVEFIDYAESKYAGRIKFLTFREAQEKLNKNLLDGHPLRASDGGDNGVRVLDLNNDGFMDVIAAGDQFAETRIWNPVTRTWKQSSFPTQLASIDAEGRRSETGVRFGIVEPERGVTALLRTETTAKAWTFENGDWAPDNSLLRGLELDDKPVLTASVEPVKGVRDRGVRLRDINGDERCELVVGNESQNAIFSWDAKKGAWALLPFALPDNTSIVDADGHDNGLRFIDVNGDGFQDVLFSNEKFFSLHLFIPAKHLGFQVGWSRDVLVGKQGEFGAIPILSRDGHNNGGWFHSRELWIQNEDTSGLPDKVERRSFDSMMQGLQPPPLSPEESLKAIRVRPGFRVELVAQEPLVQDPIAFEWGADGKLWVVEMGDYPLGVDGEGKPGGIVRFLEDTNHDGIYDKSTVFLEGLNFPTGVMPWGRGVIVSAAPEIFYAEDTDGDGKADVRKTLFTGFNEGNQQHRVNGFDYGLDGWLYGANGDSGGLILATGNVAGSNSTAVPKKRDQSRGSGPRGNQASAIDMRGRDFRISPAEGIFETQAGGAQYGRHRDDWGNWFGNNNSVWLWHYFLPENYIFRNRHLAVRSLSRTLAEYPDSTRVFPISRMMQRFNDIGARGHVTSANSATPYRDELFGPEFENGVFISEPVHNLIHREVLTPSGVSFTSRRALDEKQSEFLASADNWFRPTMSKTGPDGALYIADMYRLVIEHPEWIPDDVKNRLDLRAGHDKGRIYRVYPEGITLRTIPRLDQASTSKLVSALDSPNGWQRDTAQRLLIDRDAKSSASALRTLATDSKRPKTRMQALWTLAGLDLLEQETLRRALRDPYPSVREHAVRLCEPFLRSGAVNRDLSKSVLNMADDPDLRVRYQTSLTLGEWSDARAAHTLVKLAERDPDNEELQLAVLSSAPKHFVEMLRVVMERAREQVALTRLLGPLLELAAASENKKSFANALNVVGRAENNQYVPWQYSAVADVLDSLEHRGITLAKLEAGAGQDLKIAIRNLEPMFLAARATAFPENALHKPEMTLLPTLRLLARGPGEVEPDLDRLAVLLQPQFPGTVQTGALAALKRSASSHSADLMIANWRSSGPALRGELFEALLTRQEWTSALLSAIEAGKIPPNQIGTVGEQKLRTRNDAAIRERAGKLFAETTTNRKQVIEQYRGVVGLKGNVEHGSILFQQNCAMCHLKPGGAQPGPDLGPLADKPVEVFLEAILDPNKAVEARYVNYTVTTKDDREVSGVISAESANSITLRSPNGEETILRENVLRLESSGLSLMPEGFEKVVAPQELADIIAYLRKK